MSAWVFFGAPVWRTPWLDIGVPLGLLLFSLLAAADLVRSRFVLHVDHIEQVSVFGSRQLWVKDIESWRTLDTQYLNYVRLQPMQGHGRPMKIALFFEVDAPWNAWLGRLRSTDEDGRQKSLARVLEDDELGMLPDDRLRALSRAQRAGKFAIWVIYITGMWAIYASRYVVPVVLACLLLPVAALWLAGSRPTLVTLQEARRTDVRVSVWTALLMGALAPMMAGMKTLAIGSILPLIAPAIALGALFTAWALVADPTLKERKSALAGVTIPLILYGGSLAMWMNHALPPLKDTRAVVTVTGTRAHAQRGGPVFEVWLGPAPTPIDWRQLNVPRSTWEGLHVGSPACLDEKVGLLGVTEATIDPCTGIAPGAPASPEEAARRWLASDAPDPSARMPPVQQLADGSWKGVEQSLQDVQHRFEDGAASEADLEQSFYALETDDPAIDSAIAAWTRERPDSYAAHLVSAMHAQRVGARLREGGYVAVASPGLNAEQFERQARREIDLAMRLTRLPLMALEFDAAYLSPHTGNTDVALMTRAVALYPDDWILRRLVLRHRPLCPCTKAPGAYDPELSLVSNTEPSPQVMTRVMAERLYERGAYANEHSDAAGAKSLLESALASNGSMHDRYRAAIELASLDLKQSRPVDAVMHAQRAIGWVPEASRAYLFLGYAYETQGMLPEALAAYTAGAARGESDGQMRAAILLLRGGRGLTIDSVDGGRRLLVAADQGSETARENLRRHPELMAARRVGGIQ